MGRFNAIYNNYRQGMDMLGGGIRRAMSSDVPSWMTPKVVGGTALGATGGLAGLGAIAATSEEDKNAFVDGIKDYFAPGSQPVKGGGMPTLSRAGGMPNLNPNLVNNTSGYSWDDKASQAMSAIKEFGYPNIVDPPIVAPLGSSPKSTVLRDPVPLRGDGTPAPVAPVSPSVSVTPAVSTSAPPDVRPSVIAPPSAAPRSSVLKDPVPLTGQGIPASSPSEYVVKEGDTLWDLTGGDWDKINAIAKLNNIANPDLIYAGATLKLTPQMNLLNRTVR